MESLFINNKSQFRKRSYFFFFAFITLSQFIYYSSEKGNKITF